MVFLRRNKSQAQRIDQSGISLDGMRKIFGRSTPDSDEQNLICFNFNNRENEPFCFSGDESIFTPASKISTPISIDGQSFDSTWRYVWTMKYKELLNAEVSSGEQLKYDGLRIHLAHRVSASQIEEWNLTKGLFYLQKAIQQRVQEDRHFCKQLMATKNRFIVCTDIRDHFYAAGVIDRGVETWAKEQARQGTIVKIPRRFPLQPEDLGYLPDIKGGRNVLGSIYMVLRDKLIRQNSDMEVDIPAFCPEQSSSISECSVRLSSEPPRHQDGGVTSTKPTKQQGTRTDRYKRGYNGRLTPHPKTFQEANDNDAEMCQEVEPGGSVNNIKCLKDELTKVQAALALERERSKELAEAKAKREKEKELREEGLREIERLKREIAAEDKEIERLNKTIQIWSNK